MIYPSILDTGYNCRDGDVSGAFIPLLCLSDGLSSHIAVMPSLTLEISNRRPLIHPS